MRTSIIAEAVQLLLAVAAAVWLASLLGRAAADMLSGLPL